MTPEHYTRQLQDQQPYLLEGHVSSQTSVQVVLGHPEASRVPPVGDLRHHAAASVGDHEAGYARCPQRAREGSHRERPARLSEAAS